MAHCHGAASLASANRLLSAFLASFDNKPVKVYDFNKARPHGIEWSGAHPQHFTFTASDKGLFPTLSTYNQKMWELFQYSLPPFPATKYYKIEHNGQMPEENMLCVALSYMFWIDHFGMAALSAIHKNPLDTLGGNKKPSAKKLKSWVENADCTIKIAKMTFLGEYVDEISQKDICTKAEEFLLEPSMLVQLPWKPVLLHSWLQAALFEIQKFELESLELRHWPLTEDNCTLASNLVSSVCKLKERVILGFAIVNDTVSKYTIDFPDDKFADTILDIVILPSIPMLEFLLTGNVSKIIQNIKDTSFANTNKEVRSADLLYINFNLFRMMPPLSSLSCDFAFNFNLWTSDVIPNLFPLLTDDVEVIARKIKKNIPKDMSRETNLVKPMSLDEKYLFALVEKQFKNSGLSADDRISLTIKAIDDRVLEKGYLPTITINDIKKKFNTAKSKKMAGEIFEKVKFDYVHHAIRHALMYYQAYKMQIGIDSYKSTPAQIIAQQLLILEQEQLARLANTCAIMFHITPMIPRQLTVKSNSKRQRKNKKPNKAARDAAEGGIVEEPPDLPTQLMLASEKEMDRSALWKSLPVDWQEEVDDFEEIPGTCQNMHEVISMLCIKLGRIVFSTAQEKFDGEYTYQEWTLVQTVLPTMIRTLVEDPEVLDKAQDFCFFPLIASTVQFYETLHNNYHAEEDQDPALRKVKKKFKTNDALICQYEEWFVLTKKVTSDINAVVRLLFSFTGGKSKKFREEFKNFLRFITLNFHQMYSFSSLPFRQVFECFQNWHPYVAKFLNNLSSLCNEDYVLAEPGTPIPTYPELGDLYFATEVILEMATAINMMAPYTTTDNPIPPEVSQTDFRFRSLVLSLVMLEHRNIKTPDGRRLVQLDEEKPMLDVYDLYQILKKWRKSISEIKVTLHAYLPMCRSYPEVKKAVDHFLTGDLDALEECVVVFRDESDGEELEPVVLCRNCGKCEGGKKFIVCEKCVKDKYPDLNFYCGKKCKDMWWKTEHMAEHLEFELGLIDFSKLKTEDLSEVSEEEVDKQVLLDQIEDAENFILRSGDKIGVKSGDTDHSDENSGCIDQCSHTSEVEKAESKQPSANTEQSNEAAGNTDQCTQTSEEVEKPSEEIDSEQRSGNTEQSNGALGENENSGESIERAEQCAQVSGKALKLEKCLEEAVSSELKCEEVEITHEAQKSRHIEHIDLGDDEEAKENLAETQNSEEISTTQIRQESVNLEESNDTAKILPKPESQVDSSETHLKPMESPELVESPEIVTEKSESICQDAEKSDEGLVKFTGITCDVLKSSVEICCDGSEAFNMDELLPKQQKKTIPAGAM